MQVRSSSDETFVSTGQLPTPETVIRLVEDAYQQFKFNTDGSNSNVYPALERVPSDLFGICVVGTSGNVFGVGAIDHEFAIMSV